MKIRNLVLAGAAATSLLANSQGENMKIYTDVALKDIVKVNGNQWGLVYDGALKSNEKGKVQIHPITYKLNGIDIRANVYTPANYDVAKSYPAIVVAHPNGGVKEQVSGLFAQNLAEHGYIAIAPDAAYQGASGGEPRSVDKPQNRVEDLHRAGHVLLSYPGVDKNRLGILGICGGGGYTLKAAQSDKRFKAVATISMFNSGVVRKNGFMDSQVGTLEARLEDASLARQEEAEGKAPRYTPDLKNITPAEADKLPYDLYREGYYYYAKDYAHPNSTFVYTVSSLLDLVNFDAAANMELINQPLLMIAGDRADTLYMSLDAFAKASRAKNKELFLIKGATHIQTYFKPEFVRQEADKVVKFFGENLKK